MTYSRRFESHAAAIFHCRYAAEGMNGPRARNWLVEPSHLCCDQGADNDPQNLRDRAQLARPQPRVPHPARARRLHASRFRCRASRRYREATKDLLAGLSWGDADPNCISQSAIVTGAARQTTLTAAGPRTRITSQYAALLLRANANRGTINECFSYSSKPAVRQCDSNRSPRSVACGAMKPRFDRCSTLLGQKPK
jgi:hypothetical protein